MPLRQRRAVGNHRHRRYGVAREQYQVRLALSRQLPGVFQRQLLRRRVAVQHDKCGGGYFLVGGQAPDFEGQRRQRRGVDLGEVDVDEAALGDALFSIGQGGRRKIRLILIGGRGCGVKIRALLCGGGGRVEVRPLLFGRGDSGGLRAFFIGRGGRYGFNAFLIGRGGRNGLCALLGRGAGAIARCTFRQLPRGRRRAPLVVDVKGDGAGAAGL